VHSFELEYCWTQWGNLMDIFLAEAQHRIDDDDVLSKIDALMDWDVFLPILKRGLKRSGLGRSGYDPIILFKCLLLGQWHGLSDEKLEKALKVRLDFIIFCGLDLHTPVPDHTTHCRFRNTLVEGRVFDALLDEINRQLEAHGLKLKQADAAIIDATLIPSAARPNTYLDEAEMVQDRDEPEKTPHNTMRYSADMDARWIKKGRKSVLGYKGFERCDDIGMIEKVHVTPANKGESPEFEGMVQGAKATRIMADKASASKANRAFLKAHGYKDGIMHKAVRGRPLTQSQKRFNKLVSKTRFRVEQNFGTMKRLFGLHRARYFGCAKTHGQMATAAMGQNLLKAANKITLNPQTHAIA